MAARVAIVGRPNVGKSTLFNRLAGKKLALVDDAPGVTRDWREADARLGPLAFKVIDTAGLEDVFDDSLEARMRRQTEAAILRADLILFMVDARAGVTPLDRHFAAWLRKLDRPVALIANKAETRATQQAAMDAYELGLGDPIALSAEHGEGMAALYDAVAPYVAAADTQEDEAPEPEPISDEEDAAPERLQIAIVGRPNAGKSTLVNALIGEERVLTGPEAGLTRDAIAVDWDWQGRAVRLVDTAGLRRKARVEEKLEKLSVADSLRAIQFAHVAILIVDGQRGLDKQDLTIADHIIEEGRALVIVVNKWDLVEDRAKALRDIQDRLEKSLPQAKGCPVVTLSALTKRHLDRLMPSVITAYERWNRRVPTSLFNRWLSGMTERHPPPAVQGRRIRLRYGAQIKTRPPTFAIFVSRPSELPESYNRYLIHSLRETFGMEGVPVRIYLRKSKNPYVKDED